MKADGRIKGFAGAEAPAHWFVCPVQEDRAFRLDGAAGEAQDPVGAFAQLLHRRRVRDAQVAGRVERFTRSDDHVLLLEEPLREISGAGDPALPEQTGDVGEQVERSLRLDSDQISRTMKYIATPPSGLTTMPASISHA